MTINKQEDPVQAFNCTGFFDKTSIQRAGCNQKLATWLDFS